MAHAEFNKIMINRVDYAVLTYLEGASVERENLCA